LILDVRFKHLVHQGLHNNLCDAMWRELRSVIKKEYRGIDVDNLSRDKIIELGLIMIGLQCIMLEFKTYKI